MENTKSMMEPGSTTNTVPQFGRSETVTHGLTIDTLSSQSTDLPDLDSNTLFPLGIGFWLRFG